MSLNSFLESQNIKFKYPYIRIRVRLIMVEKMTAVWLIILTIIVCAAVPAAMIWLTSQPEPEFVLGLELYNADPHTTK